MTLVMYVVVTALVATGLFFGIRYFVRAYVRYREARFIICPESGEAAMVEVDAAHAALTSALGRPDIRLQNCWRWPIHEGCHQECLLQLDIAPAECLARGVLLRWYEFKSCHYCRKPFGQVHLLDQKPALLSPKGQLVDWHEAAMKDLEIVLATYQPVCWDCYIAQSFVRDHSDLVVYRPFQDGIHRAA